MLELGAYPPLTAAQYAEAREALHLINGAVLFEFAREPRDVRDAIIRNFVARGDMLCSAIFTLWDLSDFQDCWILHRCLMDRFLHLAHLSRTDGFEAFEEWSFLEQYRVLDRVLTDPIVSSGARSQVDAPTAEHRRRAKVLQANPPKWRRPKPEKVAADLEMRFLYRFGYDFASMHVHPMADDGLQDFHTLTGLKPGPDFPNQITVLTNTVLVGTLILQEALNASSVGWRNLLFSLLDDLRDFLADGSTTYRARLATLMYEMQQQTRLSGLTEDPQPASGGV